MALDPALSDEALLGSIGKSPEPRQHESRPSRQGTEKAQTVFRLLRAAGIEIPFGFPQEDAEVLWGAKIAGIRNDAVMQAAAEMIEARKFPDITEFEGHALRLQQQMNRADAVARGQAEHDTICEYECDNGWVTVTDERGEGEAPCPVHRATQSDWVQGGHHRPAHNRDACGHPLCKPRKLPSTRSRS